jgi:hypothetical protein
VGTRGTNTATPDSYLHDHHPKTAHPARPTQLAQKKANRPSSERRALEQSTLQRGTLFRFDGTFCSPPHHFVTPRNGSESGGLLCAGSLTYGTYMANTDHNKAAELHENAAKSHRAAAEQHGKGDHAKGREYSRSAQQHSQSANKQSDQADAKSQQQK